MLRKLVLATALLAAAPAALSVLPRLPMMRAASVAWHAGVLVALVLLWPVGVAHAGTVQAVTTAPTIPDTSIMMGSTAVTFTAGDGEANDITVRQDDAGTVRVEDRGAGLTAGPGCTAEAAGVVACPTPDPRGETSVTLGLGDGADRAQALPGGRFSFSTDGGDGDDTLTGSGPSVTLSGGPGEDTLTGDPTQINVLNGGAGSDLLQGGTARDLFMGDDPTDPPARDVYVPGGGGDTVAYPGPAPVAVDLAAGVGGRPGEDEALTGFAEVSGGSSDNTLLGDDGPNRLSVPTTRLKGLPGAPNEPTGTQVIDGRGGNDSLFAFIRPGARVTLAGGAGNDFATVKVFGPGPATGTVSGDDGDDDLSGPLAMLGGAGDDVLNGPAAESCGAGRDVLKTEGVLASFPKDCELAGGPTLTVASPRVGRSLRTTVLASVYGQGYRTLRARICRRRGPCTVPLASATQTLTATTEATRTSLRLTFAPKARRLGRTGPGVAVRVVLELRRETAGAAYEPALTYPGTLRR